MPPRTAPAQAAAPNYSAPMTSTPPNNPPVLDPLPPQTAHPGVTLTFTATATDPDGDPLKFNLENPPYGASIDADSGNFAWAPLWNQNNRVFNVVVRVTDPSGDSDSKSCQISVENDGPVLDDLTPLTAHPDQNVSFTATATDPDGDQLKFSLDDPPYGAAIEADSGFFSWTPDWNQLGARTITVRVKDLAGLTATKSCQISVENDGPTLDDLAPQTGHPGQTVTFTATASDPDGDLLKFSLVDPPYGAAIEADSGFFSWTPDWNHLGARTITVRVKDPEGLTSTKSCVITVENNGPVLDDLTAQTGHPGEPISFTATATDADNDVLHFSLVNAPYGASIEAQSGYFSWTPDWNHLGPNNIVIRVKDPAGLSSVKSCTITVENRAPTLNAIPPKSVVAGNTLTFTAVANDPDNDVLLFSLDAPPFGASIEAYSGYFSWTPATAGSYSITVRVKDPDGRTDAKAVAITVT